MCLLSSFGRNTWRVVVSSTWANSYLLIFLLTVECLLAIIITMFLGLVVHVIGHFLVLPALGPKLETSLLAKLVVH